MQVLKQTNAHVGLVFAPDGGTLYATGGSDDAVYVYTRSGSRFSSAGSIPLGHYPPGATGNARQKGLGIGVQPNAAGLDVSADGKTLVVANNYNDSITVIDTAIAHASATSTTCGRTSPPTKDAPACRAGPFRSAW